MPVEPPDRSGPARRTTLAVVFIAVVVALVVAGWVLRSPWRTNEGHHLAPREGGTVGGAERPSLGSSGPRSEAGHTWAPPEGAPGGDGFPAPETPWEEAAFALAEAEGRDIVRCAFGAEHTGSIDGAGLLMLQHAELRAGVLTAIVADQVPYEGRVIGVVDIDGHTFEVGVQRARDAPVASCEVRPSAGSSVEDWPQIEHAAPDGTVLSEDWPFTALGLDDVDAELAGLDRGHTAIQGLLTDPGLSFEAHLVLNEWMAERSAALERAATHPGTFLLR